MANTHYQTLDIAPEASSQEIRRAYLRAVRLHPPESDPEGFKAIKAAYDVLCDTAVRERYDTETKYGDEVNEFISQAEDLMAECEWAGAIRLWKQILILMPTYISARHSLGLCYSYAGEYTEAVNQFTFLTQNSVSVALFWYNFGCVHKSQARQISDEDFGSDAEITKLARDCFARAVELEPYNADFRLNYAQILLLLNEYESALLECERAISVDPDLDQQDLNAHYLMCDIYLHHGAIEDVQQQAEALRLRVGDNLAHCSQVREHFTEAGNDLFKLECFTGAVAFIKAAKLFANDSECLELDALYLHYSNVQACSAFVREFILDPQVIKPLQCAGEILLDKAVDNTKDDYEEKLELCLDALEEFPSKAVLLSISYIKSRYLAMYQIDESFFTEIEKVIVNEMRVAASELIQPLPRVPLPQSFEDLPKLSENMLPQTAGMPENYPSRALMPTQCATAVHTQLQFTPKAQQVPGGWNWGAFLLSGLWLWAHSMPGWSIALTIALLIPGVQNIAVIGLIILGVFGNKIAYRHRTFTNIEQFIEVQKRWKTAGIIISALVLVIIILQNGCHS